MENCELLDKNGAPKGDDLGNVFLGQFVSSCSYVTIPSNWIA